MKRSSTILMAFLRFIISQIAFLPCSPRYLWVHTNFQADSLWTASEEGNAICHWRTAMWAVRECAQPALKSTCANDKVAQLDLHRLVTHKHKSSADPCCHCGTYAASPFNQSNRALRACRFPANFFSSSILWHLPSSRGSIYFATDLQSLRSCLPIPPAWVGNLSSKSVLETQVVALTAPESDHATVFYISSHLRAFSWRQMPGPCFAASFRSSLLLMAVEGYLARPLVAQYGRIALTARSCAATLSTLSVAVAAAKL